MGFSQHGENGAVVVEGVQVDARGAGIDDFAGEACGVGDADGALPLGSGLDLERDREVGGEFLATEFQYPREPIGAT